MNPSATNNSPSENFAVCDGLRVPSFIHSQAKIGARITTQSELMDCHLPDPNDSPKTSLRVLRSANRVSVEPACSNTDQNTDAPRKSTAITMSRFRSSAVQPLLSNNQAKNAVTNTSRNTPKALLTFVVVSVIMPVICSDATMAITIATTPTPTASCRLAAAASASPVTAGFMPASPSVLPSTTYQITPKAMPIAVAPKPQCQDEAGDMPHPVRTSLNHCS